MSWWSIIASQLPGRTDNDIKNYWNTKLKKKLVGIALSSQKTIQQSTAGLSVSVIEPSSLATSPYSAPSPALSSARSAYACSETNFCTNPARSFSGYENFLIPSGLLNIPTSSSLSAPSVLLAQEGYIGSMHNYQVQDSFLGFEASSSSSDGSSTYDYGASNGEHVNLQSYLCNGVEEDHKFIFYADEKPNGPSYVENPLDCGLEEIKQLISTNLCKNFFVGEIKTEEKVTYY